MSSCINCFFYYGCLTLELIVFLCFPDLFFRNKEPFLSSFNDLLDAAVSFLYINLTIVDDGYGVD